MNYLKLLSLTLIIFSYTLSAQENNGFKIKHVSDKLQQEVGNDFQFLSFGLVGIKTSEQKAMLQNELTANVNFKKTSISENNEFHGFVNKDFISNLDGFFTTKNLRIVKGNARVIPQENSSQPKEFNDGRPRFIDTGNPELDTKTYYEAKNKWISEHSKTNTQK